MNGESTPRAGAARCGAALVLLILLTLLAPDRPAVGGEEDAPSIDEVRKKVETWLGELRSPEFEVREAARTGLEEHGAKAPELLEALRDDEDPEVRRTVRLLLDRMGRKEVEPAAPPGDLAAMGIVSLTARGKVPFLLRLLAEGRGLAFDLPDDVGEAWVEVSLEDAPFFEVLEVIARKAGLSARVPFDAAGRMRLSRAEPLDAIRGAAAGPLRATVSEVTSVRTLGASGGRRYMIGLDLQWLPSVQVTGWRTPVDLVARDAEGRAYKPGGAMRANTSWGIGSSARSARLQIHLEPDDPEAADLLKELSFTLPVTLRHDRQGVRFEDLGNLELPATLEVAREGGRGVDRVTLRAVERPDGDAGPWVVDVLASLDRAPAHDSLQVVLDLEDGTAQPASSGSRFPGADGTMGLRARAYGRWEKPPVAVRVTWFRAQEQGELKFSLSGIPLR